MTNLILTAAWALAVAVIFGVSIRVWRSEARAPIPMLAATAVTAWVLWNGAVMYADLIAQHSWTAATTVIPYVPIKAALLSVLTYFAIRKLLALRAPLGPDETKSARVLLAGALTAALAVLLVADVRATFEGARVRGARNPNMTAEQLAAEIERVSSGMASRDELLAFLENPLCPESLLAEYAQNKHDGAQLFKTQVARNPKVPQDIILRLSQDPDPMVRTYASYSANLPEDELPRLANDTEPMVREVMAWKKNLPDEDFARLLSDSAPRVRATAVLQPRASDEAVLRLTMDPDSSVRSNATRMAVQRGLQQQE